MRHPIMRKTPNRVLNISDFSGGTNLKETFDSVGDNQLTDTLNVWWQNSTLTTRPGTKTVENISTNIVNKRLSSKDTDIIIGGYKLFYVTVEGFVNSNSEFKDTTKTYFWFQKKNKTIEINNIDDEVAFCCLSKETIYAYTKGRQIFKATVKLNQDGITTNGWELVSPNEYYVPLVAQNCKSNGSISMATDMVISTGVAIDGYNVLSDYYKISYNAYNPEAEIVANTGHSMTYALPKSVTNNPNYIGKKITAEYTNERGSRFIHTVTLDGNVSVTETQKQDDGFKIHVFSNMIFFKNEDGSNAIIKDTNSLENNLVITAPYISDTRDEDLDKIFCMTQSTWFGGEALGLSGGTRLFLCGNTKEREKALIYWSGLNNPLYFSENTYAYVGNETQAVKGFGKQSNILVIFKENGGGTYYTQYMRNTDITASDLINQTIVDYTASNVYFPLICLHPYIGCDCPNTVQLCRNRLVWACSDGNVYTLSGQNQYSERNIYPLSDMITERLKTETDLTNAFSADWEGHYLLFVNGHIYVMDYESYGYVYASSHTKTENAQSKIPWWYWELMDNVCGVIQTPDSFFVVTHYFDGANGTFTIKELSKEYKTDSGLNIVSSFQTKFFDFGLPQYRKNILSVNVYALNNNPVLTEFVTEHGSDTHIIELSNNSPVNCMSCTTIYPCIKSTAHFGIKFMCEGNMSIQGATLNYNILGGVR